MSISSLMAYAEILNDARPSTDYCREHSIEWDEIRASCKGLFITEAGFDFGEGDEPAAFVDALDVDALTTIDVVAWSLSDPAKISSLEPSPPPILGLANLVNPASYVGGPCRLFRKPLDWCRNGCRGAVILNARRAAPLLEDLPGPIAPEDQQHLDEIAFRIPPLQRMPAFRLPTSIRRAA